MKTKCKMSRERVKAWGLIISMQTQGEEDALFSTSYEENQYNMEIHYATMYIFYIEAISLLTIAFWYQKHSINC